MLIQIPAPSLSAARDIAVRLMPDARIISERSTGCCPSTSDLRRFHEWAKVHSKAVTPAHRWAKGQKKSPGG